MIIISEYSPSMQKSAGSEYLKKMEDAARLVGIKIINFKQGDFESLNEALFYKKDLTKNNAIFWLGYVPDLKDYQLAFQILNKKQLKLVNTPEQFSKSEYFDQFYPFIKDYTIPSGIATKFEEAKSIAKSLKYPIFLKGTIQSLKKFGWDNCVASNEEELSKIFEKLKSKPDFSLGKIILRKYVELIHYEIGGNGIPKANEYRFFVLNGKIVDYSFYWNSENPFKLDQDTFKKLESMVLNTAQKVKVPFISVDIGETKNEGWKIIEIGDGQFSDIRNISPLKFWNFIRNRTV